MRTFWLAFLLFAAGVPLPGAEAEIDAEARKRFSDTKAMAETGDAIAQYNLGLAYRYGQGVQKDEAEAVEWHRKAAGQGDVRAEFNLGIMYANGRGVTKDEAEAVTWYRKAAVQGFAGAQFNLGFMYSEGQGVPKNEVEAVTWYRKAAEQGLAEAQHNLAVMYANGRGVPKDEAEAVIWYRRAAVQGYADSQSELGVAYLVGQGVSKDDAEAVMWFQKAAVQGHSSAQVNLGVAYSKGNGIPKDEANAYRWLLLAGAQGNEAAKKNYTILERTLTPAQRAEGQRLAREFRLRKAPPAGGDVSPEDIAQAQPESSGTGFFITDDAYFITNQHVADDGATVRVLTAAGSIPAKVVKVDKANDLALLKAEGKFTALPVIASRGARLGATVATVGFPNTGLQGFAPKLAKGEIASLAGVQDDARHFQISAPIQPGNSGGALVDERGNVIGVVVAKLSQQAALATSGTLAENVNYAVKSSYLLSFLESVPEVAAKLREPNTTI